MAEFKKVPASDAAWESGELGNDPKFARVFKGDVQSGIDEAMAMQPISIRLPKSLIESFKLLGQVHGLGYQPLMRRALARFAEGEMKRVINDFVTEQRRAAAREEEKEEEDAPPNAATG